MFCRIRTPSSRFPDVSLTSKVSAGAGVSFSIVTTETYHTQYQVLEAFALFNVVLSTQPSLCIHIGTSLTLAITLRLNSLGLWAPPLRTRLEALLQRHPPDLARSRHRRELVRLGPTQTHHQRATSRCRHIPPAFRHKTVRCDHAVQFPQGDDAEGDDEADS